MENSNRNEVAIEIEQTLNQVESPKKTKWCIYRVPNNIRELKREAYTPQVVLIGPFHHGNERLKNMQTHKWVFFKKFLERTRTNLDDLVSFIEELEPSIRHCYAENIVFDRKQLVKIILLDASFIIEVFLRNYHRDWPTDDALSPMTQLFDKVQWDLLLLENQLPFFVLEKLFIWALPSDESNNLPSLLELTFTYFNSFNKQGLDPNGVNIHHFMDLLRHFHLQQPSSSRSERISITEVLSFSATKLHEAGLRFEVNNESECLLGLQFSGHVLKIPMIILEDQTEILFRNMVAFGHCHYPFESYIIDYVFFLDCLIDTNKDADILIQKGVILNYLDDDDAVAKLFNGLAMNVLWWNCNSNYVQVCNKLKEFYKNPYHKLKATLRRDYCKTPWQMIASVAGIILLFLTLIQIIFSGIQVKQQSRTPN